MTGLDYILEAEPGPMKLRESLRSSSREAGNKLSFVAQKPWEHISFWKVFAGTPKANISWKPSRSGNWGGDRVRFASFLRTPH